MKLNSGDRIIADTSIYVTHQGGRKIKSKIKNSEAKLVICDSLLDEYIEHCAASGYSPASWHRMMLIELEEANKLIRVRDDDLTRIAPSNEHDSHIVNLWVTVNARAVITRNFKHAQILNQKYGTPFISLTEFLNCS